jgi:hypothetical protein
MNPSVSKPPFPGARAVLPLLAGAVMLSACWDRLAGNGSEVENAVVAGSVVDGKGGPVAGAAVALLPEGYDPVADGSAAFHRTDANGRYGIRTDTGTFNIFARSAATGGTFLVRRVRITGGGRWDLGADTLSPPGTVSVTLPEGSWEGAYAYLPGTTVSEDIDAAEAASGKLSLDSVPTGSYDVVLARRHDAAKRRVGADVPVRSDGTSQLPYSLWTGSALVTVDLSVLGGNAPASDVAGVPLLLRLDAGNFDFASAAGDGRDLRFTSDAGTALTYQVQAWDSAGMRALVWIKADTVFAGGTRLRMYWGNSAAARTGDSVFSAADGFAGVWHFDTAPKGLPSGFPDAGSAGDSAFALGALAGADTLPTGDSGAAVTSADGIAGRGLHLNGKDAALQGAKTYPGPAGYSYGLWFKTDTREGGKILGFIMPDLHGTIPGRPGVFNMDRVAWMDNNGFVRFGFTIASQDSTHIGSWQAFVSGNRYNDGQWHHLACSVSGTEALLDLDGETVVDYTGPMGALAQPGEWHVGYVGTGMWDPTWTSEYFRGSLDEIQIQHVPRGKDWLRLSYATQRPGSRLLRLSTP